MFSFRRANQGLGFESLPSGLSGACIWKISGLGRFRSVKVPGVDYWDLLCMVEAVCEPSGEDGTLVRLCWRRGLAMGSYRVCLR